MRISINLATKPFIELGPVLKRLRIVMGGLAVLAIVLGIVLHSATKKAHTRQAQMDILVQQTRVLQQEKAGNEARMHQPLNAAVLERSQFLNNLFLQKSFSWTAVMMDLENVLPAGVQVTSIEPQMMSDKHLQIRLRVSGDRDRAVMLVRNLERSQCFIAPRLASEAAQQQDQNGQHSAAPVNPNAVEFDIIAGYNPLPVHLRKKAEEEAKQQSKEDEKTAAPKARPVGVVLPVANPHTPVTHAGLPHQSAGKGAAR